MLNFPSLNGGNGRSRTYHQTVLKISWFVQLSKNNFFLPVSFFLLRFFPKGLKTDVYWGSLSLWEQIRITWTGNADRVQLCIQYHPTDFLAAMLSQLINIQILEKPGSFSSASTSWFLLYMHNEKLQHIVTNIKISHSWLRMSKWTNFCFILGILFVNWRTVILRKLNSFNIISAFKLLEE